MPKPTRDALRWQFPLFLLLAGGAGGAAGWILARNPATSGIRVSIWVILAIPVLIVLTSAWHELGHIAGGLAAGFRFHLFIAGPFRLERTGRGLRWGLNSSWALAGGLAGMTPGENDVQAGEALRLRMLAMVAGGPLFSLAGAASLWAGLSTYAHAPITAQLLFTFGGMSLLTAVATLIPNTFNGYVSDGARLLQLLRGGPSAVRWCALAALTALSLVHRPRDWPETIVTSATALNDRSFDAEMGRLLRYAWHADRRESNMSTVWLEQALEGLDSIPKAMRPVVEATAASHFALTGSQAVRARRHLEASRGSGILRKEDLFLAEASVFLAEGRTEEALQFAAEAERAAHDKLPGAREVLEEQIAEIRARAAKASSAR